LLSNLRRIYFRSAEALAAIEQATSIYRQLANALPEVFRPDLGMVLRNFATVLSMLNRSAEALVIREEANAVAQLRDHRDALGGGQRKPPNP
jgi:hypothetical protein